MSDRAVPSPGETSYDALPYPSHPVAQSHPDRLAMLATLFGMSPASPQRCRVLELGCADAGNLLALAESLPQSEFVGIDLSARHIATAQATRDELGLDNVTLRQMSVLDAGADLGIFDYIVCHGVYSWVPPRVQEGILRVCKQNLASHGVAYVSYNTQPGWHSRAPIREMMQFRVRAGGDPRQCTVRARDLLPFLLDAVPSSQTAYRAMLQEEQERLFSAHDSYVFHEHLEEDNHPVYFHEFISRATAEGLEFLAEADAGTMLGERFPPAIVAALARLGPDLVAREQYVDFLIERMFRQTLLCHADVTLRRDLRPEQVASFHLAANARCTSGAPDLRSARVEAFAGPNGAIVETGNTISKAALVCLAEAWPRWIPFELLQAEARARLAGDAVVVQGAENHARDTRLLAEHLLEAFAAGIVELHVVPPWFVLEPGERPRATALGRFYAKKQNRVANARLELVELDDLSRELLVLLDGRRDRAELADALCQVVRAKGLMVQRFGRPVNDPDLLRAYLLREMDTNLRRLARSALMVA
jgi:methyltransferase-like protein